MTQAEGTQAGVPPVFEDVHMGGEAREGEEVNVPQTPKENNEAQK